MHSKTKLVESQFTAAEELWNLDKLYMDLAKAKEKSLTAVERSLLRGLLCGYSPAEIASIIYQNRSSSTVRVYLSNGLYKYIEEMLSFQTGDSVKIQNWSRVAQLLEKAGYRNLTAKINDASTPLPNQHLDNIVTTPKQDWGEAIDAQIFYGRNQELRSLQQWIVDDRCRIVALLGMGGIGKTALSVKIAEQVQGHFQYVIWRSLCFAPRIEDILEQLLQFFATESISPAKDTHAQISQLLQYLRAFRCLIVLDGLEDLLDTGDRSFKYIEGYQGYAEFIRRLGESSHQSCLVFTSREQPHEIAAIQGAALPVRVLKISGLSCTEVASILQVKGIVNFSEEECHFLVDYYSGNPLFIKIAATVVQDVFANNIAKLIAQGNIIFSDMREVIAQQLSRLSVLEEQVLYWLTLNPQSNLVSNLQSEIPLDASNLEILDAIAFLQRRNIIDSNAPQIIQKKCFTAYIVEQLSDRIYQSIKNHQDISFLKKGNIQSYLSTVTKTDNFYSKFI
ncbi:NACHT domain-containing protein [Gloeocapsopsis crepidinum LEGE 06123]|uniref:NACHT domain-containing protein n=1 Tax=Gloeocapsopsis crepidinum LEGE 06123 TaxID=588587 RepID=A0ABR9UL84_9CHRO|nr:NB-ARC domain-containing protein [Gloeocapsopsis crepidinum]MBE9189041.1 NACHT domain-containing protein [Gloeocapsopsis crepidinum LEGE 06123]